MTTISESSHALRDVARLYVRAQRQQARCADGASTVQCHVLTELLRHPGATQQALVERLGLDKGWISRAADALAADGLVSKAASELDRRAVALTLTPAGHQRAASLERQLDGHAARLLARIPLERHAEVDAALRLLLGALDGAAAPLAVPAGAPVRLRAAVQADWPAIEQLLLLADLPTEGAREHLGSFICGEAGGTLVCAAGLELHGTAALLRSVVVAAPAQGRGIGKRMVERLVRHCAQHGVRRLYLLSTSAQAYFARLGFSDVPRAKVPAVLQASSQFQGSCPASASAMVRAISTTQAKGPQP